MGISDTSPPEQLGSATAGGKLVVYVFGTRPAFERDLIRVRTHADLAAVRARGRTGGRPKKLADPTQPALAQVPDDGKQADMVTICRALGISWATINRYVEPARRNTIAA